MNITPKLHLQTPVGRLVTGSLTVPSLTDMHGKPRAKPQYFYGIAVRKDDPALPELFGKTYQHAFAGYAQYPHIQDRMLTPRDPNNPQAQRYIAIGWKGLQFAWKIEDGDAPRPDPNNPAAPALPNPLTVGCWVFKFSSIFAPRVVNAQNQVLDAAGIQMGSFVDVAYNIEINGKTDHTAGIYANPTFIRWLAYGQEIIRGPQPDQVFKGGVPTALPPGASHTPIPPAGAPGVASAPSGAYAGHMAAPPPAAMPPSAGGHLQPSGPAPAAAPGVASHPGGYPQPAASPAPAPSLPPYNPAVGGHVPGVGGQGAANPQPAALDQANAAIQALQHAAVAPSVAPAVTSMPPSNAGNGIPPAMDPGTPQVSPAVAPVVQAAPDPASVAGSIPAGSSQVNASHSSHSPHPDFVTGSQVA